MIISIIIPIYNTEKYIKKCILSCEAQDISKEDYEIIVVNDGSPDKSLDIVTLFAYDYPNVKVISQPNMGLSAARNTGMRNASGDYYMFVDSDDWIAENCLGLLTSILRRNRPDALAICAADVLGDRIKRRMSYDDVTLMSGRDFLATGVSPCAPFAIWSADFLKEHNLKFFEGIFHEDSEFTPRAYYYANKISFTNELIYFVYQNPNSITRTPNPKRSFDLVNVVCIHLSDFLHIVDSQYRYIFYNLISMYLNNALAYIVSADKEKQALLNDALYNNRKLIKFLAKSNKVKYRIEYVIFSMFPKRYTQTYMFLKGYVLKKHSKR